MPAKPNRAVSSAIRCIVHSSDPPPPPPPHRADCAHSTVKGFIRDDKDQAMEMKSSGEKEPEGEPERKTPSKDSPLRWGVFIVYLVVTVPMLLAVIVMVAFP